MTGSRIFLMILTLVFALGVAGCAETEAEQRDRLNNLADELTALSDDAKMATRLQELSPEDLEAFGEVMNNRISATQASLLRNRKLIQKMIEYAAIDSGKVDRLIVQCEAELGVSSLGQDAPLIAECVDQKW